MDCLICGHLLQAEIDHIIQSVELDDLEDQPKLDGLTHRVNNLIERVYGTAALKVAPQDLKLHGTRHTMYSVDTQVAVHEEMQLIQVGSRYLPIPTLKKAVMFVITLGVENMRQKPSLVTPSQTIDALRLAKQLGMDLGQEELEDVLRGKIAEPSVRDSEAGPMVPPDASRQRQKS